MKNIHYSIFLFTLLMTCFFEKSIGQSYTPVTHQTGTKNIKGNNVTVSPGMQGNWPPQYYCGQGPYTITTPSTTISPSSYLFSFSTPVPMVTIRVAGMLEKSFISFSVNGVPYTLTPANFSSYTFPCNPVPLGVIVGGKLEGITGNWPGSVRAINIIGNISSVEVLSSGGTGGGTFGLYFTGEYLSACQGKDIGLFATGSAGSKYSWTGPNNFSSNVQNPILPAVSFKDSGFYTVIRLTAKDTLAEVIHIKILPTPVTQILFTQPLCTGTDLVLSDTNKLPSTKYHWTGPNGFKSDAVNPVISNVKSYHSGVYSLTTTLGQCSYTTDTGISIHEPFYSQSTEVICDNMSFIYNFRKLNITGLYQDSFKTLYGCDSIVSLDLIAMPAPELDIAFNGTTPLCLDDTLLLTAQPFDPTINYQWYLNDSVYGKQAAENMHLVKLKNHIKLIGIADNGCRDSTTVEIRVRSCCDLFIPNAFTPNNDGLNDAYGPQFYGNMLDYQMDIYSRWGQRLFSTVQQEKLWDGAYKGIPMDPGTYYYYITGSCIDGTPLLRKGDLTLIR